MVTFTIDENFPVLVELAPVPGMHQVSLNSEDVAAKCREALDAAMNTLHQMALRVVATVNALTERPEKVEVGFGLKLNAEGKAWIAKAGAEAAINIKLTWQPR